MKDPLTGTAGGRGQGSELHTKRGWREAEEPQGCVCGQCPEQGLLELTFLTPQLLGNSVKRKARPQEEEPGGTALWAPRMGSGCRGDRTWEEVDV